MQKLASLTTDTSSYSSSRSKTCCKTEKNSYHLPTFATTTANWKYIPLFTLGLQHKKTQTYDSLTFVCMVFACVYVLMLSGKYLLFYLLQRRLLNGTLHWLLFDGRDHLLLQGGILEKRQIPQWVSSILTARATEVKKTIFKVYLTSSLRGPYLASCMARADLKGVGVRGDDSRMERQMFGVLNLREERERQMFVKPHLQQIWVERDIID